MIGSSQNFRLHLMLDRSRSGESVKDNSYLEGCP
jgi:hypothetical protein